MVGALVMGETQETYLSILAIQGDQIFRLQAFFILGKEHRSKKPWSPGIKMHGVYQKQNKLDGFEGNENSRRRSVVLHRSSYVKGV